MVITASGVFANFGGVPLAFLFIASLASTALITGWLNDIGVNIYNDGFTLFDLAGVAVVYMYFQIPLMVLIILPALEGLRPSWREAAENLGARSWQLLAARRRPGADALVPELPDAAVRVGAVGLRDRRGAHRRHHRAGPDPDRDACSTGTWWRARATSARPSASAWC